MTTNTNQFEEEHMQQKIWNFGGQLDLKHRLGDNTGRGNLKMDGGDVLGGARHRPTLQSPLNGEKKR